MRAAKISKRRSIFVLGKCLWFALCALVSGAVLFLVGFWCLDSANVPGGGLSQPEVLTGFGFLFGNPFTLVPLTLILTASRFLSAKLSWTASAGVALVGLSIILAGAVWVPNPILLWPFSVLGEHTFAELIGKLFTFHIVPSPAESYSTEAGFRSLIRWQIEECGARFLLLMACWTVCIVTIRFIDKRLQPSEIRFDSGPV